MVGIAVLIGMQVNYAKSFWDGKIEVSVFLCTSSSITGHCLGEADPAAVDAIGTLLKTSPAVQEVYFESRDEAWGRFKQYYNNSTLIDSVDKTSIPESFRVKLADGATFDQIYDLASDLPGVDKIENQRAGLATFFTILRAAQMAVIIFAFVQVIAAILLINGAIRNGIRNRRVELNIMQLVGASKLRVRSAFILQSFIETILGAILAGGTLFLIKAKIVDKYLQTGGLAIRVISWSDVTLVMLLLTVGAVVVSWFVSRIALMRALKI
jgi:cell division transport system permease protein